MKRRQMLRAGIGISVGALIAGCSSDQEIEPEEEGANNPANNSDGGGGSGDSGNEVEVLDHEWYEEEFSAGVRGTLQNTTDEELSYVEVSANFLDNEGTQIGEGLDNFSDLAADREAEFDCMFTGNDASRVEDYEIEVGLSSF